MQVITFGVLLALGAAGCAGAPYKTPCEVDARIRLEGSTAEANEFCRGTLDSCPDSGCQDRDKGPAAGCVSAAPDNFIVVQDDDAIIGHELRHVWDRHCR